MILTHVTAIARTCAWYNDLSIVWSPKYNSLPNPLTHICLITLLSIDFSLMPDPITRMYRAHTEVPLTLRPPHYLWLSHQSPVDGPPSRSITLHPPHHSCLSHHTPINRPPSRSTSPPPLVFISSHSYQ